MSTAFAKAPFSLLGLAAAMARPWPWSGRATAPRGSPSRGFWLWQWVLRAGVMREGATWPLLTNRPRASVPSCCRRAVALPGRLGLVCAQGSAPAPPETLPTLGCPLAAFPPHFKNKTLFRSVQSWEV